MRIIWEEFLKIIEKEAGAQVVETWFKAVSLDRWDSETNTVFLLMPNPFVSKWIQEHYTNLIKTHLSRLLCTKEIKLFLSYKDKNNYGDKKLIPASPLQKHVLLDSTPQTYDKRNEMVISSKAPPVPINREIRRKRTPSKLNSLFTFDSLVVGPNNSLAHAAAVAVSQNPGKVYNPLFIYGGTGLGKTHLLHAIGNEIKEKNPLFKLCYETSDNFMCEFINSIKTDQIRRFREKYQKVDLLLLDDIQFFSNKEQTQETFFHLFDLLQQQHKQVVFSSDTLPEDISGLQERLKSRLQGGLVADIHLPTLETKIAILKKKASIHSIELSDEVARFIASKPVSSIRELEGCLVRLTAISSLTSEKISLELAKRILQQFSNRKNKSISIESVVKAVARNYSIAVSDLKSKNRNKELVIARQVAFYMMKKLTGVSLQTMGESLGKRDHSTVFHALNKIEFLKKSNPSFLSKLKTIEQSLLK